VVQWLQSVSPAVHSACSELFRSNEVDGATLLNDIDEAWLSANVTNALHRGKLSRALQALKAAAKQQKDVKSVAPSAAASVSAASVEVKSAASSVTSSMAAPTASTGTIFQFALCVV
jgi:hypothetical protein